MSRPPLPPLEAGAVDEIRLVEHRATEDPEEVQLAEQEARALGLRGNKLIVPAKRPAKLHRAVAAIEKALLDQKLNSGGSLTYGYRGFPTIQIGASSRERVVLLLDTIAKTLEARGEKMELRGDDITLTFNHESFHLEVHETKSKLPHTATREDLKRQAEHDEWRSRYPNLYSDRKVYATWDHVPSGRLRLELTDPSVYRSEDHYLVGRWYDRKDNRVEDRLGDAMIALARSAARSRLRREEAEDRLHEQAQEENRRRKEEARIKREKLRRQFLLRTALVVPTLPIAVGARRPPRRKDDF